MKYPVDCYVYFKRPYTTNTPYIQPFTMEVLFHSSMEFQLIVVYTLGGPTISYFLLHHWHSTEWVQNHDLPSNYGMLTSNTAESFNSMINKYCNGGWMECVNAIL